MKIDTDYDKLFVLNNNIKVYSSLTGLKITEIQGFDDKV